MWGVHLTINRLVYMSLAVQHCHSFSKNVYEATEGNVSSLLYIALPAIYGCVNSTVFVWLPPL